MGEATANVRAGLVPHLASPRLFGRRRPTEHAFPTFHELSRMRSRNILDALDEWRDPFPQRPAPARRFGQGVSSEVKRWRARRRHDVNEQS